MPESHFKDLDTAAFDWFKTKVDDTKREKLETKEIQPNSESVAKNDRLDFDYHFEPLDKIAGKSSTPRRSKSLGNPDVEVGNPDVKVGNPDVKVGNPDVKLGNPDVKVGNPGVKVGKPDSRICSRSSVKVENMQPVKVALPPKATPTIKVGLPVNSNLPHIPLIPEIPDAPFLPDVPKIVESNLTPAPVQSQASVQNIQKELEPAPIPPKLSVMSESSNFRQKQAQIPAKSRDTTSNIAFMKSSDAVDALRKKYGLVQTSSEILGKTQAAPCTKRKDIFDRSIKATSQIQQKQQELRIETLLRTGFYMK